VNFIGRRLALTPENVHDLALASRKRIVVRGMWHAGKMREERAGVKEKVL
jgi:hypothetical protein